MTREKVAIKLAKEGRDYSLEDEFQNYMQLGAHGESFRRPAKCHHAIEMTRFFLI